MKEKEISIEDNSVTRGEALMPLLQPGNFIPEMKNEGNKKTDNEFAGAHPLEILLVEDDMLNQKLAIIVLHRLGYLPDLAGNGKIAAEMAAIKHYDVILMDVQMPEMDGLEATRIIKQKQNDRSVIIAMTANSFLEDRKMCLGAGMDDYITKPVILEGLIQVLEKWSGKKKNEAQEN